MPRKGLVRFVACVSTGLLIEGCASTPKAFYRNPASVGNTQVCKTERSAKAAADPRFRADVQAELVRRGLNKAECDRLIRRWNAAIAAAILVGAAAVAVAQEDGGRGSGGGSYYAPVQDYEWDWDQFRDEHGRLVWRCRGVQMGQFAPDEKCAYKLKSDWRWPSKQAPR